MKTVTFGELFQAKPGLQLLTQSVLPVKVSAKLAQLVAKVNPHIKTMEQEHDKLIMLYGQKNKEGKMVITPDMGKNWSRFLKDREELMSTEVELPDFEPVELPLKVPVKCEKCGHVQADDLELSAALIMSVQQFVTVKTE